MKDEGYAGMAWQSCTISEVKYIEIPNISIKLVNIETVAKVASGKFIAVGKLLQTILSVNSICLILFTLITNTVRVYECNKSGINNHTTCTLYIHQPCSQLRTIFSLDRLSKDKISYISAFENEFVLNNRKPSIWHNLNYKLLLSGPTQIGLAGKNEKTALTLMYTIS